jgi:predicted RecA/RadA family phage recombinase
MPTIFVQEGASIEYIPLVDTSAGAVVVQGELVGVTPVAIKANKLGALAVEGVFDFPTSDPFAWTVGQLAYWRDGAEEATPEVAEEFKLIGKVVKVNPRPGTNYVRVRMSQ